MSRKADGGHDIHSDRNDYRHSIERLNDDDRERNWRGKSRSRSNGRYDDDRPRTRDERVERYQERRHVRDNRRGYELDERYRRERYRLRESTRNPLWDEIPDDYESSGEDEKKKKKKKKRSKSKSKRKKKSKHKKKIRSRKRARSISSQSTTSSVPSQSSSSSSTSSSSSNESFAQIAEKESISSDEEGPRPISQSNTAAIIPQTNYGGALLSGEGDAIAKYVQNDLRVPRRGEVGLTGEEIAAFENVGYVMSGDRHGRMNAVRLRKEGQVMTAEEKAKLAIQRIEEKAQREAKLLEEFKGMLDEKVRESGKK